MDDLLPRADISSQISSAFMANLTSANWKERKAALDELEQILAGAGNRIQPSVRPLAMVDHLKLLLYCAEEHVGARHVSSGDEMEHVCLTDCFRMDAICTVEQGIAHARVKF